MQILLFLWVIFFWLIWLPMPASDLTAEDVKEVTLLSNYQMVILVYFKEFHLPAINSTFDRKVSGQKGGAEEKPQAIAFSLKKKTKVKLNWRLTTTKLMSHNQSFFFEKIYLLINIKDILNYWTFEIGKRTLGTSYLFARLSLIIYITRSAFHERNHDAKTVF